MPVREDYLLRMIRQLSEALARIMGLRRSGRREEAIEEVAAAMSSVAGIDPRLVESSDASVLAALLGDEGRRRALARLCLERADIEAERGDRAAAEAWRRKALALWHEVETKRSDWPPSQGT